MRACRGTARPSDSEPANHAHHHAHHHEHHHEEDRHDLLHDPSLNKSTAFTEAERAELGLIGLVPDATESEDLQLRRVLLQLSHKTSDIDRYVYLANLLDHDETLFYRTLMSDPARFLPIVYDPTIGEACLKFGHLFRGPRTMPSRQRGIRRLAADRQARARRSGLGSWFPSGGHEWLEHEPGTDECTGGDEPELPVIDGERHQVATSRKAIAPAIHASELIQPSCRRAHRQPPASRAVSTRVGRHCIAST